MCGIAGWSGWKPQISDISQMLLDIEWRGRDATGYCTIGPKGPVYTKAPETAKKFVEMLEAEADLPIGKIGLLHTRAKTLGSEKDNRNNHPLVFGDVMVVHNGSVWNLHESYKKLGVEPPADVDSAIIAVALAKLGPIEGLKFLADHTPGTGAIGALFNDGRLLLARDSKPLGMARRKDGGIVWSSDLAAAANMVKDETGWATVREIENASYELYDPAGKLMEEGFWVLKAQSNFQNGARGRGGTSNHTGFRPPSGAPSESDISSLPAIYQPRAQQSYEEALNNDPSNASLQMASLAGTPRGSSWATIGKVEEITTSRGKIRFVIIPEAHRADSPCEWGQCKKWGKLSIGVTEIDWTILCKLHSKMYIEHGRAIPED